MFLGRTMRLLWAAAAVAFVSLAGCSSGGGLSSAPSAIVELNRESNLTATTLSGTWNGQMSSFDQAAEQAVVFVFSQNDGFTLDGSLLIGQNIRLGGEVGRDTFALVNASLQDCILRFNIASQVGSSELVLSSSEPVFFNGLLTENSYISGSLRAGFRTIGFWEATRSSGTQGPAQD
ncbi:MAG: hypothetical protein U9N45_01670 [Gemmatimonadota bacterium]|nr:hypothetical protein [Gemmatimonadota bacterium]